MSDEDLEKFGVGALQLAVKNGDLQRGCFLCGQIASLVKTEQSASEIIADVVKGAEERLKGTSLWLK